MPVYNITIDRDGGPDFTVEAQSALEAVEKLWATTPEAFLFEPYEDEYWDDEDVRRCETKVLTWAFVVETALPEKTPVNAAMDGRYWTNVYTMDAHGNVEWFGAEN